MRKMFDNEEKCAKFAENLLRWVIALLLNTSPNENSARAQKMLLFTTEDLTSPSSINTFKKKSILFEKRPVLLVILTKVGYPGIS